MDRTSNKILNLLKSTEDKQLLYWDNPWEKLSLAEDEFLRCVDYLADNGLVEFLHNQDDIQLGVALTHIAVHSKAIKRDSFLKWLFGTFAGGVLVGVFGTVISGIILQLILGLT